MFSGIGEELLGTWSSLLRVAEEVNWDHVFEGTRY